MMAGALVSLVLVEDSRTLMGVRFLGWYHRTCRYVSCG